MNTPALVTFIAYLVALVSFGVLFYRYSNSLSDYILGGRKLKSGVAALSAGASDMSGWLLLGLPGAVYAAGLNQVWIAIGLSAGAFLNWQFVAARLRRATEKAGNSITLPDYLEHRFSDRTRLLRIVTATVILIFFALYTASGLVAGAKLFESGFGWSYELALYAGTSVIVAYTFLGGFMAVSWTDFFQALLMVCALVLAPLMIIRLFGGMEALTSVAVAANPASVDVYHGITAIGVASLLAWGLGYFGQPHILARFMAIESVEKVPKARMIGIGWMIVALLGAIGVGFSGIAFFAEAPLADPEFVFLVMIGEVFNPWVAGILLAAVLSAVMSTVDSQLLVCSSALAEDFYKGFFRPKASNRELVWIGRFSVVAVALAALLLASNPEAMVLELVAWAWAGFGASFGPVILFSLFWEKMNRQGALAGVLTGAIVVLVWNKMEGGLFELYEILPGFILSSFAIVLFSYFWPGGSSRSVPSRKDPSALIP